MPKQTSLDAFFGGARRQTKKKKSKAAEDGDDGDKIAVDKATATTASTTAAAASSVKSAVENEENSSRDDEEAGDAAMAGVDDGNDKKDELCARSKKQQRRTSDDDNGKDGLLLSSSAQAAKAKKKRRVIEDDSSSDEDEDGDTTPKEPAVAATAATAAASSAATETATAVASSPADDLSDVAHQQKSAKVIIPPELPAVAVAGHSSSPASSVKSKSAGKHGGGSSAAAAFVEALNKRYASNTGSGSNQLPKVKTDEELLEDLEAAWDGYKVDAPSSTSPGVEKTEADDGIPYSVLCRALSKIEAITSRLQIQVILTELLRQVVLARPDDACTILYLASNSVAPAYECVELGIGDAILIKAIAEATGTSPASIKQKYEKEGDLGTVAQNCKGKQTTLGGFFKSKVPNKDKKKKVLSAKHVLSVFRSIATTKGNLSQKWKVDKIKGLLVMADKDEIRYIIRGLQGKLRIGLAESTVIISLAHALTMTPPSTVETDTAIGTVDGADNSIPEEARVYADPSTPPEKRLEAAVAILKKAYSEVPSYEAVWEAATKVPLDALHKMCTLTPGIPVSPMLAKPTKSIQEVLQRLNGLKFTCEYKYDGERAQVHLLPDGKTKVFSRNLLDTSEKYPEVPIFVKEACTKDVQSFVMDAEVVAFNNKTGQLVPFQILSTRKKTEESAETAKVQVIVQAFDLMYLNGKSLLQKTLAERRELLHQHFSPVQGKFQFAKSIDHMEDGDTGVIEEFLDAAVKGQCEGLMVKTLEVNAIYEPSRRSLNWLKLKKDYLDGLGDSVDLVPLGAYHGKGKRTGVYGAYLLACYDPDTEEFQSVCKIGTGFSDEDLKSLAGELNKHVIPQKSSQYNCSDQLECDVWFDAVQVWEVKAADLSKSSAHRGADGKTGEEGRGIGLRFPRFERIRDDKRPEEATTSDQILEMYYAQDAIVGGDDDGAGNDGI